MLSCGARAANIYLVVNLKEKYLNPTFNTTELYNSIVAFDRSGTVVGRLGTAGGGPHGACPLKYLNK